MYGYFSGLSVPSVTEMITTLPPSPRSNRAGQTRLPTFSTNTTEPGCRVELVQRVVHHRGVEVAAGAGVHLHHRAAGAADAFGVEQRLLVALDDRDRPAGAEVADGPFEQRGLAGRRANSSG